MKLWYVYRDHTLEDKPRVFYCGKGLYARVRRRDRNSDWRQIADEFGHQREIVYVAWDEDAAYEFERELIAYHNTFHGWGANLNEGGKHSVSGWHMTAESKKKISDAHRGKKMSDEHRARLSESFKGNTNTLGYKQTSEHRARVSAARKGKPLSQAHREAIGRGCKDLFSGEASPNAKLTWDDVRLIRASDQSASELAKKFNVTRRNISKILTHKSWISED